MKARCSENSTHNRFLTSAHVKEEWKVDRYGNWQETMGSIETVHDPDPYNIWTCAICGCDEVFFFGEDEEE